MTKEEGTRERENERIKGSREKEREMWRSDRVENRDADARVCSRKVRKEKKEKRGREFHAASRGPFKKGRENARDKVRNVVNTDGLADTSLPRLLQRPWTLGCLLRIASSRRRVTGCFAFACRPCLLRFQWMQEQQPRDNDFVIRGSPLWLCVTRRDHALFRFFSLSLCDTPII